MTQQEEDKEQAVNKRGIIKGKLTRFKSYLDKITDVDVNEVRARFLAFKPCLSEFNEIQEKIDLIDGDDADSSTERDEFETQYFNLHARAEGILESLTKEKDSASIQSNNHASDLNPVQVRLPTINLPKFSGKYEQWMSFYDAFSSLIDKNDSLSNIQKLQYLKSSLLDQAAETIRNIELTGSNYEIAIDLLKQQFHNTRIIVQNHIKSLFDLPHTHRDKADTFRQIVNNTLTHMRALETLNIKTDSWDPIIIHLITTRLDISTHREWELTTKPDKLPTLKELTDFLQMRSQTLEAVNSNRDNHSHQDKVQPRFKQNTQNNQYKLKSHVVVDESRCKFCNDKHKIYYCQALRQLPEAERANKLNTANICSNCLRSNHTVESCKSPSTCKKCGKKHHTIFHTATAQSKGQAELNSKTEHSPKQESTQVAFSSSLSNAACHTPNNSEVLLSTAVVDLVSAEGSRITCRAFLDSGSQSSFMTENICQKLKLKRELTSMKVTGISGNATNIHHQVNATVLSKTSGYKVDSSFFVLPKITGLLPSNRINRNACNIPNNLKLADPTFSEPNKIDILLGQEHFLDILEAGKIQASDTVMLQNTKLGWIVGGCISTAVEQRSKCHLSVMERLDNQLKEFWKVEEPVLSQPLLSSENKHCEELFANSVQRGDDGKYTVKMPVKPNSNQIGESKQTAVKRFLQVERRLKRDSSINNQYVNFMREYEDLGHMEPIVDSVSHTNTYYLPHHPVLKDSSTTTKLRVVFDASAKTSSAVSLNDTLMVGPTVQDDLISIILRFRLHNYVMTADIEKMYRQIWVSESQQDLLRIVWREQDTDELQTYRLKTVTYGTACAPYLATRTLNQLAQDEKVSFPEASRVISNDFYVDDLLTGTDNLDKAIELQNELITMLKTGGFNLRKWNSNSNALLAHLPADMRERQPQEFPSNKSTSKALGLLWDAQADELRYAYSTENKGLRILTKRTALSEIAKLFDPLGVIAPVIVQAKIYMQDLWKTKLNWDDDLTSDFKHKWSVFQSDLTALNKLQITRCVSSKTCGGTLELHGFCDASEKAYGAAIYTRHIADDGSVKVTLLCAKSRVAPIKTVSLPRLELCGALLLVELMSHVSKAIKRPSQNTYFWTDSTIVLSWLSADAVTWKTFVANRVAKIQDLSNPEQWRHVRSEDNPADVVSRGTRVNELAQSDLWWTGPQWLAEDHKSWPSEYITKDINSNEERRTVEVSLQALNISNKTFLSDIIQKFSSFLKIQRVTAYIMRFVNNIKSSNNRVLGPLTPKELSNATVLLVREEQRKFFYQEYNQLLTTGQVKPNSRLISLQPFLDSQGLVRVGGRLRHAQIDDNQKWPILLAEGSHLTTLIITHEHHRHLHAGPQLLLSAVRQHYWPLNGRNLCRRIVHKCITCFKAKPKWSQPSMGDLPKQRITQSRPFTNTGVDYCGPIMIKSSKLRRSSLQKGYIAIFVCFATKAIHLELVSDLTTEAFLSAFRRFTSRRGLCKNMFSDNGTNFVGANRELRELYTLIRSEEHQKAIADTTSPQQIQWHFIPPNSPHFGGLWEAGVKSVKYHLRRTIGTANLTFEELYTTLTVVEACLNSRPLTFLSADPNDPKPLTPGHFLVGEALTSLPDVDLTSAPTNRLSRWQRTQQIAQHFWGRWSKEYLSQMQQRQKWSAEGSLLQPGQVVLIREDNLPPLKWVTAVVEEIHPGADGRARVATVKTAGGQYKRAVNRLCPLPIDT